MGRVNSTHFMSITMTPQCYEKMQEKLRWRLCADYFNIYSRDDTYTYYERCTIDEHRAKFDFFSDSYWREKIWADLDMILKEADCPIVLYYHGDAGLFRYVYFPDGYVAEFYSESCADDGFGQVCACENCKHFLKRDDDSFGMLPPPCRFAREYMMVMDQKARLYGYLPGDEETKNENWFCRNRLICKFSFGQTQARLMIDSGCRLRPYVSQRYKPKRVAVPTNFKSKKDGIAPLKLAHYMRIKDNVRRNIPLMLG